MLLHYEKYPDTSTSFLEMANISLTLFLFQLFKIKKLKEVQTSIIISCPVKS